MVKASRYRDIQLRSRAASFPHEGGASHALGRSVELFTQVTLFHGNAEGYDAADAAEVGFFGAEA